MGDTNFSGVRLPSAGAAELDGGSRAHKVDGPMLLADDGHR